MWITAGLQMSEAVGTRVAARGEQPGKGCTLAGFRSDTLNQRAKPHNARKRLGARVERRDSGDAGLNGFPISCRPNAKACTLHTGRRSMIGRPLLSAGKVATHSTSGAARHSQLPEIPTSWDQQVAQVAENLYLARSLRLARSVNIAQCAPMAFEQPVPGAAHGENPVGEKLNRGPVRGYGTMGATPVPRPSCAASTHGPRECLPGRTVSARPERRRERRERESQGSVRHCAICGTHEDGQIPALTTKLVFQMRALAGSLMVSAGCIEPGKLLSVSRGRSLIALDGSMQGGSRHANRIGALHIGAARMSAHRPIRVANLVSFRLGAHSVWSNADPLVARG